MCPVYYVNDVTGLHPTSVLPLRGRMRLALREEPHAHIRADHEERAERDAGHDLKQQKVECYSTHAKQREVLTSRSPSRGRASAAARGPVGWGWVVRNFM